MTMQQLQPERMVIHLAFQKIEQSLAPIISVLSSSSSYRSKPTGEPSSCAEQGGYLGTYLPTKPIHHVRCSISHHISCVASCQNQWGGPRPSQHPAPNPYPLRFTQNPLNGSSPRHRDSFPRAMLRSSPIGPPNPQ